MKFLYIFFLLFLISCSATNKTFICGDRECIDKKEFKEYFAKNLIVEIQTKKLKKDSSIDLVKLNSPQIIDNKEYTIKKTINEKLKRKIQKASIKEEKLRLKNERKQRKIDEKNRIKKEKKLTKLRERNKSKNKNILKKSETTLETVNVPDKEILQIKKKVSEPIIKTTKAPTEEILQTKEKLSKKTESFENDKDKVRSGVCIKIENCDINKITELLIKKGREKSFPNITLE